MGNEERLMPKSLATDFGIMEQSAPESTKKSNFWYPYMVMTEIGTTGSGIIPNDVRFWFRGKSERINAECTFRWNKPDSQSLPVNVFFNKLSHELRIGFGMRDNMVIFASDIFACIASL